MTAVCFRSTHLLFILSPLTLVVDVLYPSFLRKKHTPVDTCSGPRSALLRAPPSPKAPPETRIRPGQPSTASGELILGTRHPDPTTEWGPIPLIESHFQKCFMHEGVPGGRGIVGTGARGQLRVWEHDWRGLARHVRVLQAMHAILLKTDPLNGSGSYLVEGSCCRVPWDVVARCRR